MLRNRRGAAPERRAGHCSSRCAGYPLDAGDFHVNEGDADESKGKQPNVSDESKGVSGLLKVAAEQVPFGVYAVEKNDYANSDVIGVKA